MLNMVTFVHRDKPEADSTEIYQLQLRAPPVMTNLQLKISIIIKCPRLYSNINFKISGFKSFAKDITADQGTSTFLTGPSIALNR